MTTEKQYTKAEAYEYLIENPGTRLYRRVACEGKREHVGYLLNRKIRKFERIPSWGSFHLLEDIIEGDGPFFETPEPPKDADPCRDRFDRLCHTFLLRDMGGDEFWIGICELFAVPEPTAAEPPKPGPDYALPECLSVEALRQLYVGKRPVWGDESTFARHILTEARRLDAEVLDEARRLIAEAMLAKGADEPNGG